MNFKKPHKRVDRVQIDFRDEDGEPMVGRCKQSFKDQCDVHRIISQYDRTGLITHVNTATAEYGDYSEVNEYKESLERVIAANAAFMALPSDIRKRFGNDAGEFFEFASNPANGDALVDMGLAYAPLDTPASSGDGEQLPT